MRLPLGITGLRCNCHRNAWPERDEVRFCTQQTAWGAVAQIGRDYVRRSAGEGVRPLFAPFRVSLAATWAIGRARRYPYCICQKRECVSSGKSIKRERVEKRLRGVAHEVAPLERLVQGRVRHVETIAGPWPETTTKTRRLRWSHRLPIRVRKLPSLLDKVFKASIESVIKAYERWSKRLEKHKALCRGEDKGDAKES